MSFVAELEPTSLWKHFDAILTIPRGSGNEERMRQYVQGIADKHGLHTRTDGTGNIVVAKPAAAGRQDVPITILQSHLDMVNEKNSDVEHDFDRDPIQPQRQGAYLQATGTTLGSDNGIGVASMLAVLESSDIAHGPLELLFTVDEETGLTGAAALSDTMLRGRRLINLDSEEEGVVTIGCAGGADSHLHLTLSSERNPRSVTAFEVKLSGLKGGHSGVDIHLQRGNAIKLVVRALLAASLEFPVRIARLEGGNKKNAIPRECVATAVVADGDAERFRGILDREFQEIASEFRPAEPNLTFRVETVDVPRESWTRETSDRVIRLLSALPHGVLSMSYDIPELVETSTNLAAVPNKESKMMVLMSSRSSVASALDALRHRIRAIAGLADAEVSEEGAYPGWRPDLESPLLAVVKEVHQRAVGHEPQVGAVHAGLECGIIGEKYDGMDMVSIGPQIEFPHSPDERVKINTVGDFYRLLTATLEELT